MSVTTFEYSVILLSHVDTFSIARKQDNYFIRNSEFGLVDCLNSYFLEVDKMKLIIISLDLMHWKKLYLNKQSFSHRKT